jgi:hypothetical protein
MKKHAILSLAAYTLIASGVAISGAHAQTGTPRVNQIEHRLDNQQKRIDAGVQNGQISAKAEARDEKAEARIGAELNADRARHNGHITRHERIKLNHQLNHSSKKIHKQKLANPNAQ